MLFCEDRRRRQNVELVVGGHVEHAVLAAVRDGACGRLAIPRKQLVIVPRRIFRQVIDDIARGGGAKPGFLRDDCDDLLDQARVQRDLLRAVLVELFRAARIAEDIPDAPFVLFGARGKTIQSGLSALSLRYGRLAGRKLSRKA